MSKEEMNERYLKTAKSDGSLSVNWYVENNRLYRRVWKGEGEWSLPIEYTNREMAHVMTGIENRLVDIIATKGYAPSNETNETTKTRIKTMCENNKNVKKQDEESEASSIDPATEPTTRTSMIPKLRKEIEYVINGNCAENGSDTPDFILAEYLTDCLIAYDKATHAREGWYGRDPIEVGEGVNSQNADWTGGILYAPNSCSALALARQFHDTYERLAPSYGYETRPDTREFDPNSSNGRLMITVCKEILKQNDEKGLDYEY